MMESNVIVIFPMRIEGLSARAVWTFFRNSMLVNWIMRRRNRRKRLV